MSEEAKRQMMNELLENPEKGQLIKGTGVRRKLRAADKQRGKGKRSGMRIIYYYTMKDKLYFLDVFTKNEASELSPHHKRILKTVVKELS